MSPKPTELFDFDINPTAPLFVRGVVSEMVQIPFWTLRKLDEMGVICPCRVGKRTRFYTFFQIKQLNYVNYLLTVRRVNISGIKLILEMDSRKEEELEEDI